MAEKGDKCKHRWIKFWHWYTCRLCGAIKPPADPPKQDKPEKPEPDDDRDTPSADP